MFETVLPSIRKTGDYNTPEQICLKNELDLHSKVVAFIRRFYPNIIIVAGLGENQDTSDKRITSWKQGYMKGQPDIIIQNLHKYFNGFCIEFKTPLGSGITSIGKKTMLEKYGDNNYKCMISNDYDLIIKEIIEYARNIRIICYCKRKFNSKETLQNHVKKFHKI